MTDMAGNNEESLVVEAALRRLREAQRRMRIANLHIAAANVNVIFRLAYEMIQERSDPEAKAQIFQIGAMYQSAKREPLFQAIKSQAKFLAENCEEDVMKLFNENGAMTTTLIEVEELEDTEGSDAELLSYL